ncbi:MAG: hypothetical protein MJ215_00745 [Spirochaetia bacterium]|nr:hypothetical protein [Spirochaetia bacterium]
METLDQAILSSVMEIPSGNIFDSHVIIKMLLQKHSDCYLREMPKKDDCTTKTYHRQIADRIGALTELLEPAGTSCSFNIHDKLSQCKCWKRK